MWRWVWTDEEDTDLDPTAHAPDLLRSCPVFRARSRAAIEAELRRGYGVEHVDIARGDKPVFAAAGRAALQDGALHFCRYDVATEVGFPEMEGFRQILCLTGAARITAGGQSVDVDPGSTCIIPPLTRFTGEYGEGYSHLVLQFSPDSLATKVELISGRRGMGRLDLPTMTPLSTDRLWRLKSLAVTLAGQFAEEIDAGDLAIAELSQALTTTFLRDSLQHLDAPSAMAGLSDADRLESYIHANWHRPLTVEDIAQACGVSVRSVFVRFRQRRGISPAAYLRDLRLTNARNLLLAPAGGSVIDVALKCGFASFGHFARRYREKFGELPSTTMARRPLR